MAASFVDQDHALAVRLQEEEHSRAYTDRDHPVLVEDDAGISSDFQKGSSSHYTPQNITEEDDDYQLALQISQSENHGENSDYELALSLQHEVDGDQTDISFSRSNSYGTGLSVVDESLELRDPSPNICELFMQYDEMFFYGKLAGVEVKWSARMTRCAGLCVYEGYGGLCSIRLSEPLLKLRPRRDLVQTLLHEMIHAYLFVTQNNKDHDGHGPEFQKHMNRINKQTGANITIYHSFHDEVKLYQQHWWRCDGPCRQRPPFFGYVKRAVNRPPQPHDSWWADHKRSCGGAFTKIKEPDRLPDKAKKRKHDKAEVDGAAKKKKVWTMNDFFQSRGDSADDFSKNSKIKYGVKTVEKNVGNGSLDHFLGLGKGHVLGGPSTTDKTQATRSIILNRPELRRTDSMNQHSGGQQDHIEGLIDDARYAEQKTANAFDFEKELEEAADDEEWNMSLAALARQKKSETRGAMNMVECPVCDNSVPSTTINSHLDNCLGKT